MDMVKVKLLSSYRDSNESTFGAGSGPRVVLFDEIDTPAPLIPPRRPSQAWTIVIRLPDEWGE